MQFCACVCVCVCMICFVGIDLTNPYTVVRSLSSKDSAAKDDAHPDFLLMVKIYPQGVVTPHIGKLSVGECD